MSHSFISINDLPDEIILMIWNKLNNIDVLYSFVGVNQRLNRLVRDPIYTRSIQLTKTNKYCSLPDSIIDRYCLDILPEIQQYIECLILEPSSMERILLSSDYPRLHKLTFTKIHEDFVLRHFTDESPLINMFKYNIKHLILTIDKQGFTSLSCIDLGKNLLTRIFNIFLNLIDLDFNQNSIESRTLISIYGLSSMTCYSSNLVNLSITVDTFDDCLCLLDGRLHQLYKLCILIKKIENSILTTENLKTLSNMKYFSLSSYRQTKEYDSHILPLIHQMKYLEKLILSLNVYQRSTFIDGIHLENEMLIYLPQLQIFEFNIVTYNEYMSNEIYMQSNNDLRRTFLNWRYGHVDCYISSYPNNEARSHIFSLPCNKTDMYIISYGFLGGFHTNVRILFLIDRVYPFKHEFFHRIARAFPLITELTVLNNRDFNNTDENNNQMKSIIEFHHLTSLTIHFERAIYVEQFLVDTNTYLPNLINLAVSYDNLVTVTNNFTRHSTRHNCTKVRILEFTTSPITVHPKEFYLHFPCLELMC
ncbi:unnamed protein product [Rotaria sp. Silwood2]|nr:unnamed protein product [Rotaria sp. Silwood2]CAF4442047.1 unnamed protein product [Rotaria sp. Silwood2]